MTSELKCPFCGHNLGRKNINDRMCSNEKCVSWKGNFYGSEDLWQELIRTRKELEQSEICCTEWEKQALDYKAENIALSGDLERTRKALDVAVDTLHWYDDNYDSVVARNTLDEIKTALEQKDK